ncbi:MAG: BlaI/MecI/CopY family transcriptional regulator [Gemmatimonadota bacterium]
MAEKKKDPAQLTALQAQLLEVLWLRGEATASEARSALSETVPLAITTVSTLLVRMLRFGWVEREKQGREYVYRPVVTRKQVQAAKVSGLLESMFKKDLVSFVSHALAAEDWEPGDIERLNALLAAHGEEVEPDE